MSLFKSLLSSSSGRNRAQTLSPNAALAGTSKNHRRKSEQVTSFRDDVETATSDLSIVIENYDALLAEASKNRRHSVPEGALLPGISSFLDTIDEVSFKRFFSYSLVPFHPFLSFFDDLFHFYVVKTLKWCKVLQIE
jgi:hypothetical protein